MLALFFAGLVLLLAACTIQAIGIRKERVLADTLSLILIVLAIVCFIIVLL